MKVSSLAILLSCGPVGRAEIPLDALVQKTWALQKVMG